jgi:hypothetical protein
MDYQKINPTPEFNPKLNKPEEKKRALPKVIITFSVIVSLILVSIGGYFAYLAFFQEPDIPTNSEAEPVVRTTKEKPKETTNLKQLAAARLEELTGGVKLSEIEETIRPDQDNSNRDISELIPESESNNNIPNLVNRRDSFATETIDTGLIVDPEKAKKLSEENQQIDTKIFYTEMEISDNGQEDGWNSFYFDTFPELDRDKPINQKNWTSSNYSKIVISQNDKIIEMFIFTPSWSLEYIGGNYGIKRNFDENVYFAGLGFGHETLKNPEIEFLKYLISDNELTDLGIQSLDGKEVKVFERSFTYSTNDESNQIYTTRYYVDEANFTLVQTTEYINNELTFTSKTLESSTLVNQELDENFNYQELENKYEIKETNYSYYKRDERRIQNFLEKYSIFYTQDDFRQYEIFVSDYNQNNELEYNKLWYNSDFDPRLEGIQNELVSDNPVVGHLYQDRLFLEVYEKKPQPFSNSIKIIETGNQNLSIAGESIPAEVVLYKYENEFTDPNYSSIESYLTFEYEGYWYRSYDVSNLLLISLNNLTPEQALEIDAYQNAKEEAYPDLTDIRLEDVNPNLRLLPGNLFEDYGHKLGTVRAPTKSPDESTCRDFAENMYYMNLCLIEEYNGIEYYYYREYDSETTYDDEFYVLQRSVLNTELSLEDIESIASTVANNSSEITMRDFEILDQGDYIQLNYNSEYYSDTYTFATKGGVTIVDNSNFDQKNRERVINISEIDKDFDELAIQQEEYIVNIGVGGYFSGYGGGFYY